MDFFAFVSQEWMLLAVLLALIVIYTQRERIKSGRPLNANELTQLINQGNACLVDVRDAAEFKSGHILGSHNFPWAKLLKETSQLTAHKDKTIILIDKIGQHAGPVGRQLGKDGYTVRRLSGGISEWTALGLPLVKGKN